MQAGVDCDHSSCSCCHFKANHKLLRNSPRPKKELCFAAFSSDLSQISLVLGRSLIPRCHPLSLLPTGKYFKANYLWKTECSGGFGSAVIRQCWHSAAETRPGLLFENVIAVLLKIWTFFAVHKGMARGDTALVPPCPRALSFPAGHWGFKASTKMTVPVRFAIVVSRECPEIFCCFGFCSQ